MRDVNVNSYTAGPYRRVDSEDTFTDLDVIGEIPRELSGSFVQNSPNPRFEPQGLYHWFDGDGMVHAVHLDNGKATYRNRYVRTADFEKEGKAGEALWRGIMEPFAPGSEHPDKDTANTDVVAWNGRLLSLWWLGGVPYELSLPDMQTLGPAFDAPCGVAAHPKVDPRTGELVFFDYQPYRKPYLRYGVATGEGVQHVVDVDIPNPCLFHDIAITENYTIIPDLPMRWDPRKLQEGKRRVRFDPAQPARFGVIARRGTEVQWFETDSCYLYHTVNAWEEGDEIVFVACRIDNPIPRVPHDQEPHIPRLAFLRLYPFLWEWRFNLKTGAVKERQLDDVPTEFPRMNDAHLGAKSRYAWVPRIAKAETLLFDGVIKYDLQSGGSQTHVWGDGAIGHETCFASRGDGEDEGWIMTYVSKGDDSELVILDADTLEVAARVKLPRRVPFGFHAEWVPHTSVETA